MEMPDLTKIPLGVNPSGAPPNFENPPTLIHSALGTGVALVIVGGIFLAFRLGTNLKLCKKLRLDDCKCSMRFCDHASLLACGFM